MHARATGNYGRAIRALEAWTDVEWEDGEPRLGDPLGQGITTAALADLLRLTGQPERANALAQALLDDIDVQTKRYGRGEVWLDEARSLALMLLDRPDDALAVLQRMAQAGVGLHNWQFPMLDEPLFEPLRQRPEFQALVSAARSNVDREKEKIARMRADGLIPDRR